ncbi:MAG: hypothetical protein AAGF10_04550 [Verrucomicrobiota bacterium]
MDLSDENKAQVAGWIADGLGLSEVQQRLADEFGINMTFMEVRFLVDDLDLQLKDKEPPKSSADLNDAPAPAPGSAAAAAEPEAPQPFPEEEAIAPGGGGGSVTVSLDKLQRPGALVSGSVTFSDGESMGWQLDQMGRLGLIPGKTEDYRPSESDLQEFQLALQAELQKKGF